MYRDSKHYHPIDPTDDPWANVGMGGEIEVNEYEEWPADRNRYEVEELDNGRFLIHGYDGEWDVLYECATRAEAFRHIEAAVIRNGGS